MSERRGRVPGDGAATGLQKATAAKVLIGRDVADVPRPVIVDDTDRSHALRPIFPGDVTERQARNISERKDARTRIVDSRQIRRATIFSITAGGRHEKKPNGRPPLCHDHGR
jgi:hypothetical protein